MGFLLMLAVALGAGLEDEGPQADVEGRFQRASGSSSVLLMLAGALGAGLEDEGPQADVEGWFQKASGSSENRL
jgi:hypothetical protein